MKKITRKNFITKTSIKKPVVYTIFFYLISIFTLISCNVNNKFSFKNNINRELRISIIQTGEEDSDSMTIDDNYNEIENKINNNNNNPYLKLHTFNRPLSYLAENLNNKYTLELKYHKYLIRGYYRNIQTNGNLNLISHVLPKEIQKIILNYIIYFNSDISYLFYMFKLTFKKRYFTFLYSVDRDSEEDIIYHAYEKNNEKAFVKYCNSLELEDTPQLVLFRYFIRNISKKNYTHYKNIIYEPLKSSDLIQEFIENYSIIQDSSKLLSNFASLYYNKTQVHKLSHFINNSEYPESLILEKIKHKSDIDDHEKKIDLIIVFSLIFCLVFLIFNIAYIN